jgi:hypothetical protein
VSIASVLAFTILGLFWSLIFFMDYLKYFVMKSSLSQKYKKNVQNSIEIEKFVYYSDKTFQIEINSPSPKGIVKEEEENCFDKIEDGLKKFNEIKDDWLKN